MCDRSSIRRDALSLKLYATKNLFGFKTTETRKAMKRPLQGKVGLKYQKSSNLLTNSILDLGNFLEPSGRQQGFKHVQLHDGGEREHVLWKSLDDVEAGPDGDATKSQRHVVDSANAGHRASSHPAPEDLRRGLEILFGEAKLVQQRLVGNVVACGGTRNDPGSSSSDVDVDEVHAGAIFKLHVPEVASATIGILT